MCAQLAAVAEKKAKYDRGEDVNVQPGFNPFEHFQHGGACWHRLLARALTVGQASQAAASTASTAGSASLSHSTDRGVWAAAETPFNLKIVKNVKHKLYC